MNLQDGSGCGRIALVHDVLHDHPCHWRHRLKHLRGLAGQQVTKVPSIGHACGIDGSRVQRLIALEVVIQGQNESQVVDIFVLLKVIPNIEKGVSRPICAALGVTHGEAKFFGKRIEF